MAASAQQPGGTMFHFTLPRVIKADVLMWLADYLRGDKATVWICNRLGNPLIAVRSSDGGMTEAYNAAVLSVDISGRPMFFHA
jgi:hypothetical protein